MFVSLNIIVCVGLHTCMFIVLLRLEFCSLSSPSVVSRALAVDFLQELI